MKIAYVCVFFLLSLAAKAQDFNCFQTGVKQYFTNKDGYLRGIRIDSVHTTATTTIYYPYQSTRGYYHSDPSFLDSMGGSWLGKKVIANNNGTFLFGNLWKDTVVIETQANVGDSWIFYNDSTTRFYLAYLIAKDTMTVSGVIDSIKKIKITANDVSGVVSSDPVNNFEIVLSKNHGFYNVFDLYTFPYHAPDSLYRQGLDYFLDRILNHTGPTQQNSIFSLVPLVNPAHSQLIDWNVGDIFEYRVCNINYPGNCIYPYQYYFDSITAKTIVAGGVQYDYTGWLATQDYHYPYIANYNYTYRINSINGSFITGNDVLIDTNLMPEEYKQPFVRYYFPGDTGYCLQGNSYGVYQSSLLRNEWHNIFFESSGIEKNYKTGLGLLHHYLFTMGNPSEETDDSTLIYYKKAGLSCGNYIQSSTLTVPEFTLMENSIQVAPNPANNQLLIDAKVGTHYIAKLYNYLGQEIKIINGFCPLQIDVSKVTEGIYLLNIITETGNIERKKIEIRH